MEPHAEPEIAGHGRRAPAALPEFPTKFLEDVTKERKLHTHFSRPVAGCKAAFPILYKANAWARSAFPALNRRKTSRSRGAAWARGGQ